MEDIIGTSHHQTENFNQPKPAAITLLQLQSKLSTGENTYIDLVICPESAREKTLCIKTPFKLAMP